MPDLTADGFTAGKHFATQFPVKTISLDSPPGPDQKVSIGMAELLDGVDAALVQPLFHIGPDSMDVAELQREQDLGKFSMMENDQPAWFTHTTGHFTEKHIRADTDGTADEFANVVCQGFAYLGRDLPGFCFVAPVGREFGIEFINGFDLADRDAAFDRGDYLMVDANVVPMITGDQPDPRAEAFGFSNQGAGLDPEGLGFVTGGDAAGGVRICRYNGYGHST